MKKQSLILILMCFTSLTAFAQNFKSAEEAAKKLETYTVSDIEGDKKRLAQGQELKIDQMFNDLESAVKYLEKKPLTEDLAYQMGRVTLITFIHDPSAFAIEIILPVYQKNKSTFEKAAQRLHSFDRKLLLDTLQSHDKALTEGNG